MNGGYHLERWWKQGEITVQLRQHVASLSGNNGASTEGKLGRAVQRRWQLAGTARHLKVAARGEIQASCEWKWRKGKRKREGLSG